MSSPAIATSDLWALDRVDHPGSFGYDGRFNYIYAGTGVHIYIVDSGSGYSYAWKRNGSPIGGNTQDLTISSSSSFTLDVTVSGSGAQPGHASPSVTVSGSAPTCIQA